jgi:hypothetical protein
MDILNLDRMKEVQNIITFWGGLCDTQNTSPFGTLEQVRMSLSIIFIVLKKEPDMWQPTFII